MQPSPDTLLAPGSCTYWESKTLEKNFLLLTNYLVLRLELLTEGWTKERGGHFYALFSPIKQTTTLQSLGSPCLGSKMMKNEKAEKVTGREWEGEEEKRDEAGLALDYSFRWTSHTPASLPSLQSQCCCTTASQDCSLHTGGQAQEAVC